MNVTECTFQIGAANARDFPVDGFPEIAFLGRSNVGKSSLLNRLVGIRRIARISKTPGRTREINFFRVNGRVYFVDLPGYGYAKVPRQVRKQWQGLVQSYLDRTDRVVLAVHLVDARHEPTEQDYELAEWLEAAGMRRTVVLTKIDKLSGNGRASAVKRCAGLLNQAPAAAPVIVSSVTGEGIPALWRLIDDACGTSRSHPLTVPAVKNGGTFNNRSGTPARIADHRR